MRFFETPFPKACVLVFNILLTLVGSAHARVATTPTSADQRLINPAASAFRESYGFAVDAFHQKDVETVLGLKEASIEIKTKVEGINTNNVLRTGDFTWELGIAPQKGKKETSSSAITGSGPNQSDTSSDLTLIPVQAVASTKWGENFGWGLKVMYTHINLTDTVDLTVNTEQSNETIDETKKVSGAIAVVAPGFLYFLGDSGFSLAYVAEFYRFQNDQTVQGTNVLTAVSGTGVVTTTVTDIDASDTLNIRKDVVGLGYSKKFSGGNSLRLDFSYEKMPPLTRVQGYPYGQMARAIGELNFLFFRIGAEVTQKKGYYVDPYNLIPYFFKIDHLGVDSVLEYGFFGGLKTSKGHGFGASFSQSTNTAPQKLSVGSSEQDVEKKSLKVGLSYSYFF